MSVSDRADIYLKKVFCKVPMVLESWTVDSHYEIPKERCLLSIIASRS